MGRPAVPVAEVDAARFAGGQGERHVVRCGGVAQPGGLGLVHRHITLPLPIRSLQAERFLPSVPVLRGIV